jgi:hypothetical protein
MTETDTTDEAHEEAQQDRYEIMNVMGRRSGDGSLRRVTVRVNYYADHVDRVHEAEAVFGVNSAYAELRHIYEVNTRTMSGEDYHDGIKPEVLRVAPAAERAVMNVPGVNEVEQIGATFGRALNEGEQASEAQ